jgi:quinohemoprotein ethanol dehydrogenase
MFFSHDPAWTGKIVGTGLNTGLGWDPSRPVRFDTLAPKPTPKGRLIAWNPVQQKEVWQVNHPHAWNGGVLTTASGLVFQGTADGRFVAYDADNGEKLWEINLGTGIIAAPISYMAGEKQYISIAVGWGGGMGRNEKFTQNIYPGTVYTFALEGKAPLPDYPAAPPKQLANFEIEISEADLEEGACRCCPLP